MANHEGTTDPVLESRKDRAWQVMAAIDTAFERGEIDAEGWHAAAQAIFVPAYLAGDNPRAQSGNSGDEKRWENARRLLTKAVDRDGTFLDIGCASGYLMESVQRWCREDGFEIEPYGMDISPELAELARTRLPHWSDRIFVGNASNWQTDRRFDFVRTCIDYVPGPHRPQLVRHLFDHVVAPGGRLIIGVFYEEVEHRCQEEQVASWGFTITARHEIPHPDDRRLARRVFWVDR